MRINASTVSLNASQLDYSYNLKQESLREWDTTKDVSVKKIIKNGKLSLESSTVKDRFELSTNKNTSSSNSKSNIPPDDQQDDLVDELMGDSVDGLRMKIIKDLVEMFTGKKINILDVKKLKSSDNRDFQIPDTENNPPLKTDSITSNRPERNLQGWGIDYFYKEVHHSNEGFTFSAKVNVTTDKGVEINFDASLQMNREKHSEVTVTFKAGDALIDPLVVNFSGSGTALSEKKFEFDLDADGIKERIYAPSAGNGLLVYDKNGNGIIDNGTELFGPSSGNGFAELAQFDDDKNGWIDENDPIFSKLKIWEKDSFGNDQFNSLLEKDVGALYTGRTGTNYNILSKDEIAGVIRETGLWLRESGGTGFLQEVDIVV